jgi:hypothetical protein
MRYRVAFARRFQSDGNESALNPTSELDAELADGIVADKVFVSRFDPESKHDQEVLDEDDAFLGSAAAELWEYDIVDGSEQDFLDAVRNSETVMEYTVVDEDSIDPDEATTTNLDDREIQDPEDIDATDNVGGRSSQGEDDGPGGQVTGDPTAGDLIPSRRYESGGGDADDDAEGEDSGGIDDLTVVSADDESLGLTDLDGKTPDDWAADTGPTKNPGSGIRTRK